jgi:hypothetical protein
MVHNTQTNLYIVLFCWKFVQNLRMKICPKSVWPKWRFEKIDPWDSILEGRDSCKTPSSSGSRKVENNRGLHKS